MRGGLIRIGFGLSICCGATAADAQDPYPWDVPGYKGPSVQQHAPPPASPVAPPSTDRQTQTKPVTTAKPAGAAKTAAPSGPNVGAPQNPSATSTAGNPTAATAQAATAPAPKPKIAKPIGNGKSQALPSSVYEAELARARTQMDYRDWDAALATLAPILEREPTSAEILVMRGNAYAGKGEYDQAIGDYTRAIRLETSAVAYANRALALQRKGELEQASADLDAALRIDPSNVLALVRRAGLERRQGDVEAAIRDYDRALRQKPGDPELISLRRLAMDERAVQSSAPLAGPDASKRPAAIDDTAPEAASIRRGYELMSRGEIDESIAEFDRAVVANDKSFVALTGRAQAFAMRQRFNDALADLGAALALNKSFAPIHTIRGLVFLMRGEHERAIAALDEAVKLDASSADAYAYRGAARSAKREYEAAMQDLDRAVAINPKMTLGFTTRGKVHAARNEHQQAIADFDKALQLAPSLLATTLNRGQSYEALGNASRAQADYRRVLAMKPGNLLDRAGQMVAKRRLDALTESGAECKSRDETCL